MKHLSTFILFLGLVCIAVAELGKNCSTSSDCDEDECCVNLSAFTTNRCRKIRQEGDFCFTKEHTHHDDEGVYRFMCPCVEGLDCVPEEEYEKDGVKVIRNSKCNAKKADE
ncbi:toxin CSTX-20 [Parasteatoda tepidariorum]|uniref:toxin CSTX-20 n=1 Tax=Parasteatoda tepidariorum TaxID=114398 RepID=UPI001C71E971|nr:U3-aranetoxin-Ce1a [Parasteatoda tepidariorum]